MVLELRQQLKLAQKLVMTPQLRQAIKLLQLNRLELTEALQAEIEQNPLLEESTDEPEILTKSDTMSVEENKETPEAPVTGKVAGDDPASVAEVNWEDYANNFDSDFSFARETPPADAPSQFDFISSQPGLVSHLQWQLTHLDLKENELDIAFFIIGNLDSHGFLTIDIPDICAYANINDEEAEQMVRLIQNLDPAGIAARNIGESLLLQLERKELENSLAYTIVNEHMNLLETRNYAMIARKTGATVRNVMKEIEVITSLTPFPGNEFSNEQINYVVPDVYVYKIDNEYIIQLNNDGLPNLTLSSDYKEIIKRKKGLNADSLGYLSLEGLRWALQRDLSLDAAGFCEACFSGDYPVAFPRKDDTQMDLWSSRITHV